MKPITHKQAIDLIHRRMDGMLNENQQSLLDEHLRVCDSCRVFSAEMESLPADLNHEFRARWDSHPELSERFTQQVANHAKRVSMKDQFSANMRWLAGAVALVILAFAINLVVSQLQHISPSATETINNSTQNDNDLIAFSSAQSGNSEIYTMRADGSSLTNLTNNPAKDINPIWSRDGKHIGFQSDRDGFMQIYSMDADGSNILQLTNDPANHRLDANLDGKYNPWSPDESKLLFVQEEEKDKQWALYWVDVHGGEKKLLIHENRPMGSISWSPDGKYISYVVNTSPTPDQVFVPELYAVSSDGENLVPLQNFIPQGESTDTPYSWSPSGKSIVFIAQMSAPVRQMVYELDLETKTIIRKDEINPIVLDWGEDVSLILDLNQDGSPMTWARADGTSNTFEESKTWGESCSLNFTRSARGNFAIGAYCPTTGFNLYWTNPDGSTIKKILTLDANVIMGGVGEIAWSPDEHYIAFNLASPDQTNMYVVNVNEALANPSSQPLQFFVDHDYQYTNIPSWQPVVPEEIVNEKPTPKPEQNSSTGNLIAFVSEENGNSDIYTVHSDDINVSNITNNPADDINPVWSPDGTRMAFISNRDGNENIYVMNFDGSNLTRLTDDAAQDTNPLWSPDGTKIAYASGDPSQNILNIFVMDSNGQNQHQLTTYVPNTMVWPEAWSPDSQFILFEVYRQVVQVGINDRIVTPITPQTDLNIPTNFALSTDGSKLTYLTADCDRNERGSNEFCNLVKTINRDGSNEETQAVLQISSICGVGANLTWTGSLTRWSPDQTKLLISFTCEDENNGRLYIADGDGSDFKPLTDYPVFGNLSDHEVATFEWSPDSQSILFAYPRDNTGNDELYTLKINEALANPSLRPTPLNASTTKISGFAWQPLPVNQSSVEKPMTEATPVPPISTRLITFTSPQDGNSDIFVMNRDGSEIRNLTNNIVTDRNPVWSPDGQKIAFESDRNGKFDVFIMNPDGSELTQITTDPSFDALASSYDSPWSPDGKWVIVESNRSGQDALYVTPVDGKSEAVKISDTAGLVTWSPNGNQIAFSYISEKSALNSNSEQDAVRIVNSDGSNAQDIVQTGLIRDVQWSTDSKTLYYVNGLWSIERVDTHSGTPESILNIVDLYTLGAVWFSPDSTIVYESIDSQSHSTSLFRFQEGIPSLVGQLPNQADVCESTTSPYESQSFVLSHDTTQALSYTACESGQVVFTVHDLTSKTSTLLGTITVVNPEIDIDWSQDDQLITIRVVQSDVSLSSSSQASLYVLSREELIHPPSTLKPVIEQTNGLSRTTIQPMP